MNRILVLGLTWLKALKNPNPGEYYDLSNITIRLP
jgi:hypothetical protein